jgi:hypothetical protein
MLSQQTKEFAMINGRKILVPPELKEDISSAKYEIIKNGMDKHEARVCLILDVSGSMQEPNQFFSHPQLGNRVQKLINKALALAFLFDDNQQIEVFPFGDTVFGEKTENGKFKPLVIHRDNFTAATDIILKLSHGYRDKTYYGDPVKAVRQFYFNDSGRRRIPQSTDDTPVFAIFVTDGEPNGKEDEAMQEFASASHQAIFFKFIALSGKKQEFSFLNGIDNPSKRSSQYKNYPFYIDNSNFVLIKDPLDLTIEALLLEYRPWLSDAYKKKLLLNNPGISLMDIHSEGRIVDASLFKKQEEKIVKSSKEPSCLVM